MLIPYNVSIEKGQRHMQDLEKQLKELQQQISSYTFPLTFQQVRELDNLKRQYNKIKYQIFIRDTIGENKNE